MKNCRSSAFFTLEIVIVIVIIAILLSYLFPKFGTFLEKNDLLKLKADLALIQNGIQKEKVKAFLVSNELRLDYLDEANIDKEGEELFTKVLSMPLIATNMKDKKNSSWAKISSNRYVFFTRTKIYEFSFDKSQFLCMNDEESCKELE